jgi:hypothetical protein
MGYKIKNGGVGKVAAIIIAQPMLIIHAEISRTNRKGHSLKSLFAQLYVLIKKFVTCLYQQ